MACSYRLAGKAYAWSAKRHHLRAARGVTRERRLAGQGAAHGLVVSDTVYWWIQAFMLVVIVLGLIGSFFLARSNRRMGEETQRRLEQKRAQTKTAEANIDALAGRPQLPFPDATEGTNPGADS